MDTPTGPHVVRAGEGDATGEPGLLDRYLIESAASSGLVALVEHVLGPKALAAPMHRHSREDEYTFVLAGTLGVIEEGIEITATAGDLVAKPRGRWHTFWNAGGNELRVLEIIVPGGIEGLFRRLAEPGGEYSPETLPALAAEYGAEVDFEATMPLVERHGLVV
ncbi:quercetin dioxygenase-like cupin family protein [Arthrobacter sp. V1I9]|jgi:quercetin dioxygenase-like cupin family protein|uniref:cupin domain-containing protein n=1 Tax=Arthrobacter sp. V1I9 TaxID=3042275 RepID=UPI00278F0427|nr:cupin domain-containing protein [Arthrobacter sp. V1I9]MDQ0869540.1 quercetin dioxygenase-like cupin family protein [Arthrobacter sp. V1I9]